MIRRKFAEYDNGDPIEIVVTDRFDTTGRRRYWIGNVPFNATSAELRGMARVLTTIADQYGDDRVEDWGGDAA